jgi:hypothetical protein
MRNRPSGSVDHANKHAPFASEYRSIQTNSLRGLLSFMKVVWKEATRNCCEIALVRKINPVRPWMGDTMECTLLDVSSSLSAPAMYWHIGIGIGVGPDYGKSLNVDARRLINLLMRQRFSL